MLYLYLRGMAPGSDTGVFSWRPPASLVVALSEALAAAQETEKTEGEEARA